MADTYESKMARRVQQGTAVKVGNKYYAVESSPTIAQTKAASKLGMTLANIASLNTSQVAERARNISESQLTLALEWLSRTAAIQNIEANRPMPDRPLPSDTYNYELEVRQGAKDAVSNIRRVQILLDPIRRNMQMEKAAVLKSTYAQAKGFSSDDPYEEMVATNRAELEWYSKLYGTEDPIRIEALKTLERRDNQGKTSYELALEGKEMSAENVDALIAEIDETALADQVTLALQEEQKQVELAREASERRNKILLYFSGSVGIAILLYRLIRR